MAEPPPGGSVPLPSDGAGRLERALEAMLAGGGDPDALLRDNPDLRDLLEPMLDTPTQEEHAPESEPRLGEFRNLREIGRGGMGVVYEAEQTSLSRKVALKVLPGGTALDPTLLDRFRREAASAASLEHPGIVKIHALGGNEQEHWIAMELVTGGSLRERMEELRARGVTACAALIATVAEALQHAHERGVIHCDVKPANILLREDLTPVLTDFGLARSLDRPAASTVHGFVGTPYYASPEQARGQRPDARSDVFSLGATLFVLSTGERPFPGETTEQVLERVTREPPPDPKRIDPRLPDDLCAIVLKALEKEPTERYQTAGELAADLRAFLAFRPVSARRPTPAQRFVRWTRREPLRATVAAALLVATGVGAYLVIRLPDIRAGERVAREHAIDSVLIDALRLRHLGDAAAARLALERGLADFPDCEDILTDLVYTAWQGAPEQGRAGSQRDALALLRERRDRIPGGRALRRLEAALLVACGDPSAGRALEATLGEPQTPLEFYVRGKVCANVGHADHDALGRQSLDALRRAVLASERPRAALAYEYAAAVYTYGAGSAAGDVETLILAHWPDLSVSWYWISVAHLHANPKRAEQAGRKAVELDPRSALAHRSLGVALWVQRRYPESEAALLLATRLEPDLAPLWVNLATTYLGWAKYQEAIRCAEKSLALDPKLLHAKIARLLGKLYLDDLAGAEAELAPLLAERSRSVDVMYALGCLRLAQSRAKEAIPALRTVVAERPWSDVAWSELGTALCLDGQREEARKALEKSLAIWPENPQALVNLGILEHGLGLRAEGKARVRAALRLDGRLAEAWSSLAGMSRVEGDWTEFDSHVEAWLLARPGDAMPKILKAQRILDGADFDAGSDGERVLELVRALATNDASERLEARRVELRVLAARGDPVAALHKLEEARARAHEAGWTDQQIEARLAADEARLRREARRQATSRPASAASEPASGRAR